MPMPNGIASAASTLSLRVVIAPIPDANAITMPGMK
jgi:hypothetical protein